MAMAETQDGAPRLRDAYRDLFDRARRHRESLIAPEGNRLASVIDAANALHGRVRAPLEQAIDSELFSSLSGLGAIKTSRIVSRTSGSLPGDLISALRAAFCSHGSRHRRRGQDAEEDFDWGSWGEFSRGFVADGPGASTILGPIDAPVRARARAQRASRRAVGAVVTPEEAVMEEDRREVDKKMWVMVKRLQRAPGMAFVDLVVDPESFSRTVENMFTLSFLAKDGRVETQDHPDLGTVVYPSLATADRPGSSQAKAPHHQFIMSIGYEEYEWMKSLVTPGLDTEEAMATQENVGSGKKRAAGGVKGSTSLKSPSCKRRKSLGEITNL
eukprot:evm.model.scf_1535.2 EVM.evm.TU.scf_1535.2   scf_1535:18309-20897(+)